METSFVICFGLIFVSALTYVESGYLLTAPRIFRAGSTQEISVSLFSVSVPWIVNATLLPHADGVGGIIATDGAQFTSLADGTLKLEIPRDLNAGSKASIKAKLSVLGGPVGGKQAFLKSHVITIEIPKSSIFIQTDKPIYKPGQTVNMRIVGTDENLKPLKGKIAKVTVTNPSKVRIMQWNNLDVVLGMASLRLPLSSQPVLGDWKIDVTYQDEKKTLVFKVDKYVLPKFKVTITPPPFVAFRDSKDISATICARYTYGQPVKGNVSVVFTLHHRSQQFQTTVEKEIHGCTDVSVSQRLFGHNLYYGGKVAIQATVREAATGVSRNATGTETKIVRETTKVEFLSTPTDFKPGMPFAGKVKATLIDGSPLTGQPVDIVVQTSNHRLHRCSGSSCKKLFEKRFTVPASGIVDFVVNGSNIPQETKFLKIKVSYKGKSSATHTAKERWFSPSNSYIEMKQPTSPRKVGSTAKVKFDFTTSTKTKNINFHYQVFSRGKLVAQGRKLHPVHYAPRMKTFRNSKNEEMFLSQGFIEFVVTQSMVPSCRILLFYVREDQEAVAANMLIDTKDTLENEVRIRFVDSVRQPGEHTRLIIKAAGGSQVAVTAVDKSVHLLKGGNELTIDDAIDVLSSQDVGPPSDARRDELCYYQHYWSRSQNKRSSPAFYGPRRKDFDASRAFKDSGVIYFSDLEIETAAKCEKPFARFMWMQKTSMGLFRNSRVSFVSRSALPDVGSLEKKKKPPKRPQKKPVYVRKEFPETWLWTEEMVNKNGKIVLAVKVPDTITSWVASAFAISNSSGLGISEPTSLKVFQPFFVSLTLPYSVIRGEEVSIIASVFNYESMCLTIRLSLEDSFDYRITSNASQDICVCSNEAKSVRFGIVPKKLGQIPLAVVAKDLELSACGQGVEQMRLGVSDAVVRKLLVEPEGVRQEYTYSSFACLKDDKSFFNDSIEIALPQNVVPGSVYAMVSTVGDLMGPTLNVESLLRLPYGCGEQNMVNFAPSIYIMKYLSTVGQLTSTVENKAKNIMSTGYQRELSYKRTDGSYSAWGNRDPEGNMWLTAFVLRSFAQARPFIFVDEDELKQTSDWITTKQQSDGCFPKYGRLIHKDMKGGVTTEAALTAFVTVSLMEAGISPQDMVIQNALNCLRSASSGLTDSYTLALFAFTFALAKDRSAMDLFKALQSKAITKEGLMHWEKEKETPSVPPSWRCPYYRAPAGDIEMTAYALMTYVLLAEGDTSLISEAMSIVRWLTKQRNALGGFASTQDTCVGLQALSQYASQVYSSTSSLFVQFGDENALQFSQTFNITENNRLVSQRAEIPSNILPMNKLPVEVQGEGCALMQADVSYNIADVKEEPAFDLKVQLRRSEDVFEPLTTEAGELLCIPLDMFISAKWLREDSSNMAVIDVKLVSGYKVDEESLGELMNRHSLGFKRYEIQGQHVILYFDEIDKVSFSFKIFQSTVVKQTKPASVTVYDYYETHLSATMMYKITEDMCRADPIPVDLP